MISARGYLVVLVAFHLVVVCYSAPVSSNAPPAPVVPAYSVCDTRKTKDGGCCVFPFTYRGEEYYDCTTRNHNTEWCATTSDYDANSNQWGECVTAAPEPVFDKIMKANIAAYSSPGTHFFQGDIVVDNQIRVFLNSINSTNSTTAGGSRQKRAAMGNTRARWITNGRAVIPYEIESSNAHATTVILRAMRHWESKVPCLKFMPRASAGAAGRGTFLSFFRGGGCYSMVGRQSNVRRQRISIGSGCETMGVVAHEIGHALGFWHEQSRPDRDRYVTINWQNIPRGVRHNFNKYSTSMINSRGVSYDYDSLMHYSSHAFSSNGRPTIVAKNGRRRLGQRYGLTSKDAQQMNLLYCGSNPQTPRPPRPPTPPPPGCPHTDNDRWCPFWKSKGYCNSGQYRSFMLKSCKKSCLCGNTVSPCKDNDSNCSNWFQSNYCNHQKYGPYVRSVCRKSCKLCT